MNIGNLEQYFEDIATAHIDINQFIWGDAFEQIQDLLKRNYEISMIVDSPDFTIDNHQYTGLSTPYFSELVILKLTDKDDKAKKQSDLDATKEIILEVYRKIIEDLQENENYQFELKSKVTQTFLDNRIGWRFSFSISFDIDVNLNPDKWQSL